MAEEKNQPITKTNPNNGGRGRARGRGFEGGRLQSSSSAAGRCNNQQQRQYRGPGRGNGNHSCQSKQETNTSRQQRNRNNHKQRPPIYSHHDKQECKRSIEGPYAHLFCSERHGFALSRVLYPTDEVALSSCYDAKSSQSCKITSAQLEKWWECVKLVRCHVPYDETSTNQSSLDRCPICLDDDMTAPHIGPCGHTFCLPCVLGYLNSVANELNAESERICKSKQRTMDGRKSVIGGTVKNATVAVTTVRARCPMCSSGNSAELNIGDAMITYRDLRPVIFVPVSVVKAKAIGGGRKQNDFDRLGTKMKFVKLHRVMDCLAPYLPMEGNKIRGGGIMNDRTDLGSISLKMEHKYPDLPDGDEDVNECVYSRQYYVGCNEYDRVLERMLNDLIKYRDESVYCQGDNREKWNVNMSIEAIQASLRRWMGSNISNGGLRSMELEARETCMSRTAAMKTIPAYVNDAIGVSKNTQLISPGAVHLNRDIDECLYYQACDGQLCFLSGINVACLTEEFSLHCNEHSTNDEGISRKTLPLPDSIEGTVIGIETLPLTPTLMKRKHFLSHLPLGSSVVFAEVDWYSGGNNGREPMLTKATLSKFRQEIYRRKSERQHIFQLEEKDAKAARIKSEKADRRRREEAFSSAHMCRNSRQTIDPDDEFFKMPSPSMGEKLDGVSNEQNPTSAFRFNQVCAEGGAFPELVGSRSPVSRVTPGVMLSKSPPALSSWGGTNRNHLSVKQLDSKSNSCVDAFPPLAVSTRTSSRSVPPSGLGNACGNK